MESAADKQNPEQEVQRILAKVLTKKDADSEETIEYSIETSEDIKKQASNVVFSGILTVKDQAEGASEVIIDLKSLSINEAQAKTLVNFITSFSTEVKKILPVFNSWKEYVEFKPVYDALNLEEKVTELKRLHTLV